MKKKIIIVIVLILIYFAFLGVKFYKGLFKRYDLGEFGVSIETINSYTKIQSSGDVLTLYNPENGITINTKFLGGDFWREDEMSTIMDQYIRLISAMNYDCSVLDVTYENRTVKGKEIGFVCLTIDRMGKTFRTATILTHRENGYLAIEMYGTPETIKANEKEIDRMINSLRFDKNTFDYTPRRPVLSGDRAALVSGDISGDTSGETNL